MAFFQGAVVAICVLVAMVDQSMAIVNRDLMAIDINDILSEKLMPLSLIYVKDAPDKHSPLDFNGANNQQLNRLNSLADFSSALTLMQFHRKMIQNYKCNNYIARQILTDIAPHTLQNRLGIADINSTGKFEWQKSDRDLFYQCFFPSFSSFFGNEQGWLA